MKSWYAARYYFPNLKSIHVFHAFYKGQCTVTEISRVAALAQTHAVDAIIGVGGGKVLDVVKAAASAIRTKSVLISNTRFKLRTVDTTKRYLFG